MSILVQLDGVFTRATLYASAGISRRSVFVCLCVCLSHAGQIDGRIHDVG